MIQPQNPLGDILHAVDQTGEAREHLDWCVQRAMEYANAGDMSQAWASFLSDVRKHPGTEDIFSHPITGMEMLRQTNVNAGAEEFRKFITGWNA